VSPLHEQLEDSLVHLANELAQNASAFPGRLRRDVLLRQLGLSDLETFPGIDSLDRLATSTSSQNLLSIFSRLKEVREATDYHINSHLSLEHVALAT